MNEDKASKVTDFVICLADVCIKIRQCFDTCGCQVEVERGEKGEDAESYHEGEYRHAQ